MEERTWTAAQKSAIDCRDKTLLVSAAAGSGKTAVLTERIIQSLCDTTHPVDISRLLVVTFTRTAAAELRERISAALMSRLTKETEVGNEENVRHLTHQLMMLGSAKISTIDAFYLDLVRTHFEEAGFPPSFRMATEADLLSLSRDTMNAVIDEMYAEEPAFSLVADLFSEIKSEQSIADNLMEVAEKLNKLPEQYDFLLRFAKENEELADAPFDSTFGKTIYGYLGTLAENGKQILSHALSTLEGEADERAVKKYSAVLCELQTHCQALQIALDKKDADAVSAVLLTPFSAAVTSHKPVLSDAMQHAAALALQLREKLRTVAAEYGVFDSKEIKSGMQKNAEILRLLHRALTRFGSQLFAAKMQREIAEFSDVSRAAFRLLVAKDGTPTPLAKSLAESFDAIYIDEYQDVDAMQDATFRAISGERNRFMVGDIKQSIFRFRGADHEVFSSYRKALPPFEKESDRAAESIFMSDCFRCDRSVIDFSNAVSGFLFRHPQSSIGYKDGDALHFHKKLPNEGYLGEKCRVMLISPFEKKKGEEPPVLDETPEETLIANEILTLLESGKKADGSRILPSDIAVLASKNSTLGKIAAVLRARGIPTADGTDTDFFENAEVLCVYSLLAVIDNPFRDVYLAATLRSPFFGFTLQELVQLRRGSDRSLSLFEAVRAAESDNSLSHTLREKISAFLTRLSLYREKSAALSVDKLLRYIYRDSAVLSFAKSGQKGEGDGRRNLLRLYEYARSFEAGGFKGLYQFVRYVEDIMENGTRLENPVATGNAVTMLSIHKSKGLEFPVCFVAGTGSLFSDEEYQPNLLIDKRGGCGVRVSNLGSFSLANTFPRAAVRLSMMLQAKEEQMRVLYVALTRARERLYVTGKSRKSEKRLDAATALAASPVTDFFAIDGNNYLEWMLAALDATDYREYATVMRISEEQIAPTLPTKEMAEVEKAEPTEAEIEAAKESFAARFAYRYPHAHLTGLPAKLSVSKLTPRVLDVYDGDGAALTEDTEALLASFERTPSFGGKKAAPTAAERGTATHEFLQFCDFAAAKKDIGAELARLTEAHFLPPESGNLVRISELQRFFESDLYREIEAAGELHRETRFNVFLPAEEFTENKALRAELCGEQLLVQGVIDLFFTDKDGKLVLCDYKTDRLPPEAMRDKSLAAKFLFARHKRQLDYYKKALTALCGKAPDKTIIYSLPLGAALEEAD